MKSITEIENEYSNDDSLYVVNYNKDENLTLTNNDSGTVIFINTDELDENEILHA